MIVLFCCPDCWRTILTNNHPVAPIEFIPRRGFCAWCKRHGYRFTRVGVPIN